jgi:DNA-binding response OmpR family regulator
MARAKRILLVDDDELLRDTLLEQFEVHDEFKVEAAPDAASAIEKVKEEAHIDLVLLDVGLPDMDGREACRVMRKNGFKSPVIMLTGADTEADTILGLDAGANDYVTKPFKFSILLARLRAHLRSHEQSEDAVFKVGPYEFKPAVKMLVTSDDRKIKLTEKETSILKFLYRAGGQPVSRDVLLDEVWGYNSGVTTHTLETHIYRLRQKIEPDTSQASLLLTESGGYRLAVEL